jgi:hypothetical protein
MRTPLRAIKLLLALCLFATASSAQDIGAGVQQLIVSVAPDWNSTTGRLQLFRANGRDWKAVGEAWPVLYGRTGLAWGRGVLGTTEAGLRKVERDGRAPAGVFESARFSPTIAHFPRERSSPSDTVTLG